MVFAFAKNLVKITFYSPITGIHIGLGIPKTKKILFKNKIVLIYFFFEKYEKQTFILKNTFLQKLLKKCNFLMKNNMLTKRNLVDIGKMSFFGVNFSRKILD